MNSVKSVFGFLFLALALNGTAQVSIHQEEQQQHAALGLSAEDYQQQNIPQAKTRADRACNLNKVVYGWHPYWSNGLQSNYDWNLLSHLCYFSYELDATTGNATTTHSFSTTQVVTDALNNGVRVDLCVTLFSNHATFLNSATAKQNFITTIINLISARGAHGVNIDFEGLPSSQATNFRNFMNDLANQMHAAIPGSQVSTVLYSVDWSNVFDVANMTAVDYFIIMGYDYYYSGSSTAGPNDPLFQFSTTYNYTLSKSVTYYLDKGVPNNKLVLGLPYYGREWATTALTIPSATTATGVSRTYAYVRNNSTGFYSSANRHFDAESYSTYYTFTNSGPRQCFITEENDMNERLDFINKRGIAGMGIWALGYDDGYNEFWDAITNNFTDCASTPCSDSLYDIGGGYVKSYYDNEDYTYTISPAGAQQINLQFINFSVENNYDYLYVYDGPTTASAQIPGSPFTGTTVPANFSSSSGSLTFRFTSDGSTTSTGWLATYSCVIDNSPPVSTIVVPSGWQTNDFTATLTDTDAGTGIDKKFWQVLDNNGTEWRANSTYGFFNDNFDAAIHPDWTTQTGTWSINAQHLFMNDEAEQNSNIFTPVTQNNANTYLYHWQASMDGTGNNRRSGIHFFCSNSTQTNRANSYLVYFRVDTDKCQIYESVNDVLTLITDDDVVLNANTFYDYKVVYDPSTGKISAFVNNIKVSEWTDPTPLQSGSSVSLRSGGTTVLYDDVKIYRTHNASETITTGSSSDMIRYQNANPTSPSCRIKSLSKDLVDNWSAIATQNVNIDWTAPIGLNAIADGSSTDLDTSNVNTSLTANWSVISDPHSGIAYNEISVGNFPGDVSVQNWTNIGTVNNYTINGLFLNYGQMYYINLRTTNNAGLWDTLSTDGIYIQIPAQAPIASFSYNNAVCTGDSVSLINTSSYATSFAWTINGGTPATSTLPQPSISFPATGSYSVTLVANGPGGTDTITQNISIAYTNAPVLQVQFTDDTLYLPSGFLGITNTTQNATSWYWNFGDGGTSTDENPWHIYSNEGSYQLMYIASNGVCDDDTLIQTIVVLDPAGIESEEKNSVSIYPNPFSSEILINAFENQVSLVEVFDVSGRLVYTSKINQPGIVRINTELWAKGSYVMQVSSENFIGRKIIIKN